MPSSREALDCSDVAAIRALREALDHACFAELLLLSRPTAQVDLPWPDFTGLRRQLNTLSAQHAELIRLFGLGETVAIAAVERWLPESLLTALAQSGFLVSERDGEVSTGGLCIVPFHGLYVLANPPPSFPTARKRQQDVCLDRDSIFLARQLRTARRHRTLELCSGSGLLALAAARFSDAVTGCEWSPTAVAASRFSAVLSGVERSVEFRQGDLFDGADGRYELILANPPYAPVPPGSCDEFLCGDGGIDGLRFIRLILGGLERHLADGGEAMIIAGGLCADSKLLGEREISELARRAGLHAKIFLIDRKRVDEHIAQMRPFVDHEEHYRAALGEYCAAAGATHYAGFYLHLSERGAQPARELEVIDPLATRHELVRALRQRGRAARTAVAW